MNVRELVTVLKFKTDTASVKTAENTVNRIKTTMEKLKPVDVKFNIGKTTRQMNELQKRITNITGEKRLNIKTDTAGIDQAINKLKELDRQQQRTARGFYKGKVQGASQGKPQPAPSGGGMGASSMLGGLKGAFVALGGMALVNEIKQTADAMMSLSSRIKLVTKDETERLRVERALYDMSNRNRASLEDVGDLYYKTALSAKQFGISQEDLLRMTDIVTKSLTIGGADTAQQKATILQLSQALGSGVLQGDELRSLRENAPKLMTQIAQYFGKTVAELKEMGAKGELTTDQLVKAILASGQTIDKEFGRITPTIGQAITVLGNKWSKFILDIQNNTGVFGQIAGFILDAVDWIGKGIDWAKKEFKTLEPDFQDFFGNLKKLWTELQPLLDNLGTIFRNWIIPALKIFLKVSIATFGMVADLLKPIVDFLDKIASLIATISGGLPGIIKGFENLIGKAESGALQQYRNIMTENNQTNNITVASPADAGRALRESNTFFEASPVD